MGTLEAKKTLINDKARLMKYFPLDVQKEVARNSRNIETQRDILLNHVEQSQPALARLFNDNYYSEIDEIIEFLEKKYPSETQDALDRKLGLRPEKKTVFVKRELPKETKKIKVKRGKKTHTRNKSVKFENKTFLKNFIRVRVNEGATAKEITQEYNSYAKSEGLKTRSTSSLNNFRYRNNIKKKK